MRNFLDVIFIAAVYALGFCLPSDARPQNLTTSYASVTVNGGGELGYKAIGAINPVFPVSLYYYKPSVNFFSVTNTAIYANNTTFNSITVNTQTGSVYSQYQDEFRFYTVNGGLFAPGDVYNLAVEYMSAGTSTVTPTMSPTASYTASPSPTFTATKTVSATATKTATMTSTATRTRTPYVSATVSKTRTVTRTPTTTATATPTRSPTQTLSFTISPTFSVSPTGSMTQTPTITPTLTRSPTLTTTPTSTATPTPTPTPSISPSPGP